MIHDWDEPPVPSGPCGMGRSENCTERAITAVDTVLQGRIHEPPGREGFPILPPTKGGGQATVVYSSSRSKKLFQSLLPQVSEFG
jgi:hypothetical protein